MKSPRCQVVQLETSLNPQRENEMLITVAALKKDNIKKERLKQIFSGLREWPNLNTI